jgi:anti-sigma regulatory factor (Ser/Thr protein kinase)
MTPEHSTDLTDTGNGRGACDTDQSTPPELLRLLLRSDPTAPRLARKALGALEGIDRVRDDAILVSSELVSNAVVHGGRAPGGQIELIVQLASDAVLVTVIDGGGSDSTPTMRDADYRRPGGLGLRVVDALALRWGSAQQDGQRVWAELAL